MKRNCKQIFALVFTMIMAISCVSAVSAATNTYVFLCSDGIGLASQSSNSSVYTAGAYGVTGTTWNAMSSTTGGVSKGIYKDSADNVASLGFANSTPLYVATVTNGQGDALTEAGISPLTEERYSLIPLLKTNQTNPSNANSAKFSEKVEDFANATVKIDLAKGSGYGSYDQTKIVGYKVGLAFVDYAKGSKTYTTTSGGKTTTRYVYRADFAWLDIAADSKATIHDLPVYSSSRTFAESKHTVSFSVSDILTNGTHKKINGADTDVTAANANALVIGVILNDATYYCGGALLFFNNLNVVTVDDTPEPDPNAPVVSGDREKADFLLWSRTGVSQSSHYNADVYDDRNVYVHHGNNTICSATGGTSGSNIYTQQDRLFAISLNSANNPLAAAYEFNGASPISNVRYRLLPLSNVAATAANHKAFKDYYSDINNFTNGTLKVDLIKGGGFANLIDSETGLPKYEAFKIGLAYIDYSQNVTYVTGSSSTRTVNPTDIAWLDITDEVEALNTLDASTLNQTDWNTVKTEISVSVNDIINNGDHWRINGAGEETHILTAQNANAVVFGIVLEESEEPEYFGDVTLYGDNIHISSPVPSTSISFDEESNIDDGVILNIQNGESSDMTPLVFVAYYLGDFLVNVHVDTSFTAEAGYIGAKSATYPIDNVNVSSDKVVVMALDGSTFKPLCPNFVY